MSVRLQPAPCWWLAFGQDCSLLSMDPNARQDTGAKGTLEAYCSGPGLVQTWKELTGSTDSGITGHDVVSDANNNPSGPGSQSITKTGCF